MASPASDSQKRKGPMRPTKSVGVDFDDKPLWNHTKAISTAFNGGRNRTWSCNYCNKQVSGSYNRVKGHLLRLSGDGVQICSEVQGGDQFDVDETIDSLTELSTDEPQLEGVDFEEEFENVE
ncbi:uncharacterized protein LOC124888922 [Capsicum annuum]|uniref:uncharacterized protein LOC124888922 n=1 Tax=Capsicum annuum TaxID=4072 RepID=UPI001FB19830|nr:uncharacterized protein LOC124888922 [Capsicum annuum]